jgi:hypothetical protein
LPTAPLTPSSYVLGRFLRAKEKYITAKAASNTPPTIKIKVVTMLNSHRLGPYNIRPRSHPARATLNIFPYPVPAARRLAPPWMTSTTSSSTTPQTKSARLFLSHNEPHLCSDEAGSAVVAGKVTTPAHDLQRRGGWPVAARFRRELMRRWRRVLPIRLSRRFSISSGFSRSSFASSLSASPFAHRSSSNFAWIACVSCDITNF